jgi:Zn finger protein HypA/HybF involved in hydrogenase expression
VTLAFKLSDVPVVPRCAHCGATFDETVPVIPLKPCPDCRLPACVECARRISSGDDCRLPRFDPDDL